MSITPAAREAVLNMLNGLQRDQGLIPGRIMNLTPRVAQTIEDKVMQTNDFLQKINNVPVREIKGDILGFGVPTTITKRTRTADSKGSLRRPVDPTALEQRSYECFEVEQDSLITWDKIDQWAHLPNFYELFRQQVLFAMARDRLLVLWWGQQSATQTNPATYSKLQDVNTGLIKYLIDVNPSNVLGLNTDGSVKPIKLDATNPAADFRSIDELVNFMRYELLHELFADRTGLRVLVGNDLVVKQNQQLLGASDYQLPTERVASSLLLNSQSFAEVERVKSDEFPRRGIFLSELSNMSRYWQASSYRRKLSEDDHEHKGMVDYSFVREDYVLEAAEGAACVHPDAIHLIDPVDGKWKSSAEIWKIGATRSVLA